MIGGSFEELTYLRWLVTAHAQRLADEGRGRPRVLDEMLAVLSRPEPSTSAPPGEVPEDADMALMLTLGDVARVLRVSVTTVERQVRSGALTACAIGRSVRVRRDDLLAYIAGLSPTRSPQGTAHQETA